MFSCEFCEISNNTFFHRTPPSAASAMPKQNVRVTRGWFVTVRTLSSSSQFMKNFNVFVLNLHKEFLHPIKAAISDMFIKLGVLKNRNIHRKTPVVESLFNTVAGLQACKLIKKKLQHRCFPENIAKFLRTAFLQNNYGGYFRYHFVMTQKMSWIPFRVLHTLYCIFEYILELNLLLKLGVN